MTDLHASALAAVQRLGAKCNYRDSQINAIQILLDRFESPLGPVKTHYENCHHWHDACLLARIRDVIGDDHG